MFSRYTITAVWITPLGLTSQVYRCWSQRKAEFMANALRAAGQGHCTVSVIGPCGGLL